MSGGTLVALAADQIVMAPSAVLGPVDPQLGEYPAASILTAVGQKDPNETDDKTLILADVARKAQVQVRQFVNELLRRQLADQRAAEVAAALSEGRWTHDFPIDADLARSFDLKVSTDLPDEVRLLMRLYPQPRNRRPSVEYIPSPTRPRNTNETAVHPRPGPPTGTDRWDCDTHRRGRRSSATSWKDVQVTVSKGWVSPPEQLKAGMREALVRNARTRRQRITVEVNRITVQT